MTRDASDGKMAVFRGADAMLRRIGDGGILRSATGGAELASELERIADGMVEACEDPTWDDTRAIGRKVRRVASLVSYLVALSRRKERISQADGRVVVELARRLVDVHRATVVLWAALADCVQRDEPSPPLSR